MSVGPVEHHTRLPPAPTACSPLEKAKGSRVGEGVGRATKPGQRARSRTGTTETGCSNRTHKYKVIVVIRVYRNFRFDHYLSNNYLSLTRHDGPERVGTTIGNDGIYLYGVGFLVGGLLPRSSAEDRGQPKRRETADETPVTQNLRSGPSRPSELECFGPVWGSPGD